MVYGDLGSQNAQSIPRLTQEVLTGKYDAILHVGNELFIFVWIIDQFDLSFKIGDFAYNMHDVRLDLDYYKYCFMLILVYLQVFLSLLLTRTMDAWEMSLWDKLSRLLLEYLTWPQLVIMRAISELTHYATL